MQYKGYLIGPMVRRMRKSKNITVEEIAEQTGLSTTLINRVEQGTRPMTMTTMLLLMDVLDCDANTLLSINNEGTVIDTIDMRLYKLPDEKRKFLEKTFLFMIEQAEKAA